MTTSLPVVAASTVLADHPSKIAANPEHLILLAVLVLAGLGYLLYRRNRTWQDQRRREEESK